MSDIRRRCTNRYRVGVRGAACVATVWLAVGLLQLDTGTDAGAAESQAKKLTGPPPLVVDKDSPLLLGGTAAPTPKATRATTENQACFVCHANYQDEPLAILHARENVGCADCHGKSFPHRNDENNTTPPDVMYPASAIAAACRQCHETHNAQPEKVVARWLARCPQKTDPKRLVCTDCHGQHRLKIRTVRWDKKTRKLESPESRVRSPESGVRSPESRVQSPESRVQSPESRVQRLETRGERLEVDLRNTRQLRQPLRLNNVSIQLRGRPSP